MATGITAITVDNAGTGYTNAPQVTIVGGGGGGAIAHATVVDGAVTAITVDVAGTGYTNLPTIEIRPGSNACGSGATAHATIG